MEVGAIPAAEQLTRQTRLSAYGIGTPIAKGAMIQGLVLDNPVPTITMPYTSTGIVEMDRSRNPDAITATQA